jgi:hypothetical protein
MLGTARGRGVAVHAMPLFFHDWFMGSASVEFTAMSLLDAHFQKAGLV